VAQVCRYLLDILLPAPRMPLAGEFMAENATAMQRFAALIQ
jgi:hypothetical protein